MDKGSFKEFFAVPSAHQLRKIVTLGLTTGLLVAMVNLDASASTSSIGRSSIQVSAAQLLNVGKLGGHHDYSGVIKRHRPLHNAPGSTTTSSPGGGATPPTTTTPTTVPTTSTSAPPATTTTSAPPATTTTAPSLNPIATGGPIVAGASRSECLEPDTPDGGFTSLTSLQSTVSSFNQETHSSVTCLLVYLNGAPNWGSWQDPWVDGIDGAPFTSWVAEAPQTRQLVLQVDLIPSSLKNISNPLAWEQSCASGDFDAYATELGKHLVADGLQSSVIRLGPEMNGTWENDSMGTTTQEQNLWATCFANEVTGLRQAAGEHFLIDWNPNACTQSVPYTNFYPGNAYVDIVGLDFYDMGCDAPSADLTFAQLSNETYGLTSFEAFAKAQGKPMSFPEWGLADGANGDDPAYINGIGATVANNDFAFEAYFDAGTGLGVILGPGTPQALVAFQNWFGTS